MPAKPRLTVTQILRWADAHRARTGKWPKVKSGPVTEGPEITWAGVDSALRIGVRGLPGGSSLARVLEEHRGVRNHRHLPPLSIGQILKWTDAHHKRTGRWPCENSGRITEAPEETWFAIGLSLRFGRRGLPRGSSLARVLARHRGKRNPQDLPSLTTRQVLRWADAHRARTGKWPKVKSGPVTEGPEITWAGVDSALRIGVRGLPGGSSLARVLEEHRGVRNHRHLPPLSIGRILKWADAHHKRTGRWPVAGSGRVIEAPGEIWNAIHLSLKRGQRGLPGGSSLARLLAGRRGRPKRQVSLQRAGINRPIVKRRSGPRRLTVREILIWADRHHERTGRWPKANSGVVRDAPHETWRRIKGALYEGSRGLPGGSSLARLLAEHRNVRNTGDLPRLTIWQILAWADEHRRLYVEWPQLNSGPVKGAPGETWARIDTALRKGMRGLPPRYSLARLLAEQRGLRNRWSLGRLTIKQILIWADKHKRRTGTWPVATSGPVADAPGESWSAIGSALIRGGRGFPGGDSLSRLLVRYHRADREGGRKTR